jgi:hypothetical protein
MKIAHTLFLSAFLGVAAVGAVVGADTSSLRLGSTADTQSAQDETKLLTKLNSQPTFSDSTLRRPF